MNQRMIRAAAGLASLFAASTMASTAGRGDTAVYNPNPPGAADALQQITYLRDQLAALPARFAGAANDLQSAAPAVHPSLQPGDKGCYALSTTVSFSFDYGAGPIRTPMVRILQVPVRAGDKLPALNSKYYPDLPAFLRANQTALGDTDYTDVKIRYSLIGCAATAEELRPMQQQANLAFYLAIRNRVSARIESDYARLRAIIYSETQDPVLTHPPGARP